MNVISNPKLHFAVKHKAFYTVYVPIKCTLLGNPNKQLRQRPSCALAFDFIISV